MAQATNISWCDSTVNLLVGCSGCELYPGHCYANALVTRHAGKKGWPESFTKPRIFPERTEQALKWPDLTGRNREATGKVEAKPWLDGMPRMVFVNDLGDTFSPAVTDEQLDWVIDSFSAMANSPHTWLFLTKWPGRMRVAVERYVARHDGRRSFPANIWLGVSVTDQATANARIPELLRLDSGDPAARAVVRFVSCEPMLERVDFSRWANTVYGGLCGHRGGFDCDCKHRSWVIFGGKSGPDHYPLDIVGMESAVNQCSTARVPCFVKQDSGQRPGKQGRIPDYLWRVKQMPKVKGVLR